VELEDIHDKKSRQTKELILNVPNWNEQLAVSSIQLISEVSKAKEDNRFSKSGLIIEPLKFNFLNNNYNQLQFYFETYNTGSLLPTDYLIRYSLVKNGFRNDTLFAKYKRRKKSDIDPIIISEIFSDKWPSGDYLLNVEMMDFQRNVLSHNYTQLVISNARMEKELEEQMADSSFVSKLSEEALIYALKAVAAKVNPNDIDRLNHLIRNGSRQSRVSFIEGFWNVFSPFDPEGSYIQYMKVVRALDDMYYDGLGRGFETDRGYIYLKYGRPTNMVAVENDPTAPPYEIWFYDDFPATMQTNVKFVFYNPTLVHNKYELLHSNAKGELNNPQWLIRLYNNSPEDVIGNRVDATDVKDYWNRRAAEIFNDN
jgi:GWxTD domain-containing protein